MKHTLFLFCTCLLLGCLHSCKEGGNGRKSMLQPVTGGTNELLVITPKVRWEGAIGDTIREYFGQAQAGLPQGDRKSVV